MSAWRTERHWNFYVYGALYFFLFSPHYSHLGKCFCQLYGNILEICDFSHLIPLREDRNHQLFLICIINFKGCDPGSVRVSSPPISHSYLPSAKNLFKHLSPWLIMHATWNINSSHTLEISLCFLYPCAFCMYKSNLFTFLGQLSFSNTEVNIVLLLFRSALLEEKEKKNLGLGKSQTLVSIWLFCLANIQPNN